MPSTPQPAQPPQTIDEVYINFCGEINYQTVNNLMQTFSQLVTVHATKKVYFSISSPGGQVDAGVALYNFLISIPIEIHTYNMGSIDSIANMIFIAGKKRYAMPSSTFLFHGIKWGFPATAQVSLLQLKEIESKIMQDENKIADIISSRCQLTKQDLQTLFIQGESKDLTFAKDKGIIEEIRTLQIPLNAKVFTIG